MLTLIVIYWILTVLGFYVKIFYVKFRIFLVGESRNDLMYVDPDRIIFCCTSGLLLGELDLKKVVAFPSVFLETRQLLWEKLLLKMCLIHQVLGKGFFWGVGHQWDSCSPRVIWI